MGKFVRMILWAALAAVTACEPHVTVLPDGLDPDNALEIELYSPDLELFPCSYKEKGDDVCYIPAEGKTFSIFPRGKVGAAAMAWDFSVDSVWVKRNVKADEPIFSGDWGCISNHDLKNAYYEIFCKIAANPNNRQRVMIMEIQRFNNTRRLRIEQAANVEYK